MNLMIIMGLLMGVQGSSFSVESSSSQKPDQIPGEKIKSEFTAEDTDFIFKTLEKYQETRLFVLFKHFYVGEYNKLVAFIDPTTKKFDKNKFSHTLINKMISEEKKDSSFGKLSKYIRGTTALIGQFVEDKDVFEFFARLNKQNQNNEPTIEPTIEIYLEDFKLFEKMMKIQQSTYMFQLEILISKLTTDSINEKYTMFKSLFHDNAPEEIKKLLNGGGFDKSKVFKQESTEERQPIQITKTKTTFLQGGIALVKQLLKCAEIQGELKLTESTTEAQITAEDQALLDKLMETVVPELKTAQKVGSDSDDSKKSEAKPKSWAEEKKKLLIGGAIALAVVGTLFGIAYGQSNSQENNQNNQNNQNNNNS